MQIIVDGDACPVKQEIFEIAARHNVHVLLVASSPCEKRSVHYGCLCRNRPSLTHDMPHVANVEVLRVDPEPQAADIAVTNRARAGDIVVTGDYGLACMVLGRRARAIGFRGEHYTDDNIDGLMAQRHLHARARRHGARQRGPRPFSATDRAHFTATLERLLSSSPLGNS